MTEAYDQGFADGLLFVAQCLRRSATIVETPIRGDYGSNGKVVNAIARSGNTNLATAYRNVAALLESSSKDLHEMAATLESATKDSQQ